MNQITMADKKRKFLLVLPILVFPFLTALFWSVGLFAPENSKAQKAVSGQSGFNMQLPDAKLKDNKSWNKLDYYAHADQDSAKLKEVMKNDPYYRDGLAARMDTNVHSLLYDPSPVGTGMSGYHDPGVEKINQKLSELKTVLNQPQTPLPGLYSAASVSSNASINNTDVDRLQNLMQTMNQKDGSPDPEMQQLNGMMDKLLDIQYPERVKGRLREQSKNNKRQVYLVTGIPDSDVITVLKSGRKKDTVIQASVGNGFYSLNEAPVLSEEQNAISAVVAETQTLVSGATVKMRLLNDMYLRGMLVPKNQFVYGNASLNGERLQILISSIRCGNNLLPVSLSVYDADGNEGINVPGAITRDVAKQSAGESISSMGVMSVDPSIGTQAATAGINAVKTLLSKKVKLVKVTLKEGYHLFLKDNNNKQ